MLVAQRIIMLEYSLLAKSSKRIRSSYDKTEDDRIKLWDAATGGCFQQTQWSPDLDRVKSATEAVATIVRSFS